MNGSAPKFPATGFHARLVRKLKPNSLSDTREFIAIATIIATTNSNNTSALANNNMRNTASPTLPVGDNARRKLHARTVAPYSAAGVGSAGCGDCINDE